MLLATSILLSVLFTLTHMSPCPRRPTSQPHRRSSQERARPTLARQLERDVQRLRLTPDEWIVTLYGASFDSGCARRRT